MPNNICFVAGRSGGHIVPCLTIAQHHESAPLFFSTTSPLDRQLLGNNKIVGTHVPLRLGNVPYKKPWLLPQFIMHLATAFFKSFYHLHAFKPTKIITTGSYIAIPVCLAGWLLRIPIELLEVNVKPGSAIKFLAPCATTINICFTETQKYLPKNKCVVTKYPVRFTQKDKNITKTVACKQLNLDPARKTILVLGGSQGSIFINNLIKTYVETNQMMHSKLQIIHQTGAHDATDWQSFYKNVSIPAVVFDYRDDISNCYTAADVVISRAGAGSMFETLFFAKPCITIPLESKTNTHQRDNARAMANEYPEFFTVLRQQELNKSQELLAENIHHTLFATQNKTSQTEKSFYTESL